MKKITFNFCLLFLVSIMTFCARENQASLGNDYYYLSVYEARDVGYPEGAIVYKSSKEYVYEDIKIHGEVISVNHDNDFIIAIREKKDSSIIIGKQSSNVNRNVQYFIIEKKSDSVYGPFDKEKYLQKRTELNVPEELKLKEI